MGKMLEFTMSYSQEIIMQILFTAIMFDILTGVARATKEKRVNSTIGLNGVLRHLIVVMASLSVGNITHQLEMEWVAWYFVAAFSYQYLVSIMENWSLAGYKIPSSVAKILDKLPYQNMRDGNDDEIVLDKKQPVDGYKHDKNDIDRLGELRKTITKKGHSNKEEDN